MIISAELYIYITKFSYSHIVCYCVYRDKTAEARITLSLLKNSSYPYKFDKKLEGMLLNKIFGSTWHPILSTSASKCSFYVMVAMNTNHVCSVYICCYRASIIVICRDRLSPFFVPTYLLQYPSTPPLTEVGCLAERRSLAGEIFLSCAGTVADG